MLPTTGSSTPASTWGRPCLTQRLQTDRLRRGAVSSRNSTAPTATPSSRSLDSTITSQPGRSLTMCASTRTLLSGALQDRIDCAGLQHRKPPEHNPDLRYRLYIGGRRPLPRSPIKAPGIKRADQQQRLYIHAARGQKPALPHLVLSNQQHRAGRRRG